MGLILAAAASVSSVLGDQWKEFFYCKDMGQEVLARKGERNHGKSGLMNGRGRLRGARRLYLSDRDLSQPLFRKSGRRHQEYLQ